MKHEWKKHEKELYGAKVIPSFVTLPKQSYMMITGKGNPNQRDFSERVGALYALAYAVKMDYKAQVKQADAANNIQDYTVYPLEGVWQRKKSKVKKIFLCLMKYFLIPRRRGYALKYCI